MSIKKIKELQESIYLIERGADRLTVRDKERIAELKRQINELRPKEQTASVKSGVPEDHQLPAAIEKIKNLPKRGKQAMCEDSTKLSDEQIKGLKRLMEPFDKSEISKLPKPTKAQTEEVKKDYKKGIRCDLCGGWHHPKVVHLDYVGHAALTKRLLEVDPLWNWEPFAVNEIGEPKLDSFGGMWGWLTVCGVTRRGYGDAEGKTGSNANKERIGDFIRNAAMRFGAALDLWSKADLSKTLEDGDDNVEHPKTDRDVYEDWIDAADKAAVDGGHDGLVKWCAKMKPESNALNPKVKGWVNAYVTDLKKAMAEEESNQPPATKQCPAGGDVTDADCESCDDKVCEQGQTIDFMGEEK